MPSTLQVRPVSSSKEWKTFLKFPWEVYRGDPLWVPPLFMDMNDLFNKKKNPFLQYGEVESFVAWEGDRAVGRIVGVISGRHNLIHKERAGFFGFFECLPNRQDAADALFAAAGAWCKARGAEFLRGPECFCTNDDFLGFLAEGFDRSPYLMMSYNPKYYLEMAERAGFKKAKDLYAFKLGFEEAPPALERIERVVERLKRRNKLVVRPMNMRRFPQEVEFIKDVYNHAWSHNWGFVPMTDQELDHFAGKLKMVSLPDTLLLAEIDGQPAGVALALPDYNEVIKTFNGKIGPIKLLKLLMSKKKIKRSRGFVVGVKEQYRKSGLNGILVLELYQAGKKLGYTEGELSWVLEDNQLIINDIENMGGVKYKTYRLYQKEI